jgi:hypothetical protein
MAFSFGKKGEKKEKVAPKAAAGGAQAKQPKSVVSPDFYTVLLGVAALFFITAAIVLGFNYQWYLNVDPDNPATPIVPVSAWAK